MSAPTPGQFPDSSPVDDKRPPFADMDVESFRHYGHAMIDWIATYLGDVERYPVLSQVKPGEVRAQFSQQAPEEPGSMDALLQQVQTAVLPGITHWNSPNFFAYFGASSSGPGILGELLTAALNTNGMLWKTSPAATEVEELTLDWLRQMLGLPDGFHGIITDTASMSSLLSIAVAREALNLDIRQQGMAGRSDVPRLRLYASEEAHSSIEKGAMALGLGQQGLRKIPTNAEYQMDDAALAAAIAEDSAAGWRPFYVAATIGTTSTTSIDPVPAIAAICRRFGLWLHIDGAYGGVAAIVPEFRHVLAGCEDADSIVVNPHKWLFTPIDCSAFYVRRPDLLRRAFSLVPDYLVTDEAEVTNYMDWGVQLGRRFRALKLWMVISYFGHRQLANAIAGHIRLGQQFADWVDASPRFERLAPAPFSTVCFRAHPQGIDDEAELAALNTGLMEAVNASGAAYLSHTKLRGVFALRLAIGNLRTTYRHVNQVWELLQTALDGLLPPVPPTV